MKINLLDVPAEIVQKEGTVSDACARELAKNVAKKLDANIGISFTGVAGPNRVENKPVGTVFIGIYINGLEEVQDRKSTRLNSSHVAISYAVFCLKTKI